MALVNTSVDTNPHAAGGPIDQREDTYTSPGTTHDAGELVARDSVTDKLIPYNVGGANGANIVRGVLNVEKVLTAGDHLVEYIVGGVVRLEKLSALGGDPIDFVQIDELQGLGIYAKTELELADLDNA